MAHGAGTYRESDIAWEGDGYWVLRVAKGFEVYKTGVTHSVRCATIGFAGQAGLDRAIAEANRRIALQK